MGMSQGPRGVKPFLESRGGYDEVESYIKVNITPMIALTWLILPQILENKKGIIINVSSLGAKVSGRKTTPAMYKSTKVGSFSKYCCFSKL